MEIFHSFLKLLRKLFNKHKDHHVSLGQTMSAEETSCEIEKLLSSEKGVMIARYGSTELCAIRNYLGVKAGRNIMDYIKGKTGEWWWNPAILNQMQRWSGFYPATESNIARFSELMMADSRELDLLGSWCSNESQMRPYIGNAKITLLRYLEPFWTSSPWTKVLKGKKVLVVHPFAKSILSQYDRRDKLFDNPDTLPEFESLRVIQAVQSLGKGDSRFKDWFEALEWMKGEINKEDYDVCLIGCGAYGFPLAAHVKRQGKKAIHLGGALQLLFGIRGRRWDDPEYGVREWGIPKGQYSNLVNEYWVRPSNDETPSSSSDVEGKCYW